MRHDELIAKVRERAELPDRSSAGRTTRAVLSTLAERVPDGLADHLAARLAESIRERVCPRPPGVMSGAAQVNASA